jgi:hypothetical protein
MALANLVELATVKSYLGVIDNFLILDLLNDAVTDFIEGQINGDVSSGGYCNRKFLAADYTSSIYTGNDRKNLLLRQYPINSITTIVIDGTTLFPSGSSTLADLGFYIDNEITGNLIYYYTWNSWFPNNIEITYNAGFTAVPNDIVMAALKLIEQAWNQRGKEGFKSEKFKNYSYTLADLNEKIAFGSQTIAEILDSHKRPTL